jgi:hypothetical protein
MKKLSILLLAVFFIGIANVNAQTDATAKTVTTVKEVKSNDVVKTECTKEQKEACKKDASKCCKNKRKSCCKDKGKSSCSKSKKGSFNFNKSNNYGGGTSSCSKKAKKECGADCAKACCAKTETEGVVPTPPPGADKPADE